MFSPDGISDVGRIAGPLLIRETGLEDAELLLHIIHSAFQEYVGRIDPPTSAPDDTLDKIHANLDQGRALIAVIDQHQIGCVFYQRMTDHVYLYRLAVLPEYRRRGVARRLIESVEEVANDLGFTVRLGTRVALPENQRYYERMGYHVVEYRTHPGYDRPTYVMMEKVFDHHA
jgi:ribosomal protein S18 acetylase RimI-like enzyme